MVVIVSTRSGLALSEGLFIRVILSSRETGCSPRCKIFRIGAPFSVVVILPPTVGAATSLLVLWIVVAREVVKVVWVVVARVVVGVDRVVVGRVVVRVVWFVVRVVVRAFVVFVVCDSVVVVVGAEEVDVADTVVLG